MPFAVIAVDARATRTVEADPTHEIFISVPIGKLYVASAGIVTVVAEPLEHSTMADMWVASNVRVALGLFIIVRVLLSFVSICVCMDDVTPST